MNDRGLASIVIPAYNPGRYLEEALESAVAQSYPRVEIVVVDDGSTEDIATTVRRTPGIRFLRQANLGVAAARDAGAAASKGRYLVFLDADDRLRPDAVEVGIRELEKDPAAAFASGLCQPIGAAGESLPFRQQPELQGEAYVAMLRSNFIWMPAQVVYRREAFEAAGGFYPALSACADYDLYLHLTRAHPVVCHRHVVADYRFHHKNMSADLALMLASALGAIDRQWPYVKNHAAYRHAYWEGRRFWREFYGSGLVEEIRAGLKAPGSRFRAVRGAAILFRHHPLEALRQFGRKLRCMASDLVGATR